MAQGKVYLVGGGPGDPGLLTLKGAEALRAADVVVYDRLIDPRLLRHTRAGCEQIYAGKLPNRHTLRQDEINALLKGGDEGRLTAYVESAFTPAMRKAGPGDPGILPFLLDLSRGTAVSRSCARWGTGRRASRSTAMPMGPRTGGIRAARPSAPRPPTPRRAGAPSASSS